MRNKKEISTTKLITFGGVFSALSFVFLFLASIVPGLEMTFYAAASIMPAFMILEYAIAYKKSNAGPGITVYVVTVLLGILLIPNKVAILPYAWFFGIYGIIKYYVEKFEIPAIRVGLKLVFFGGIFSAAYFQFKDLLIKSVSLPDMAFPVLLVCSMGFLLLYDYIFTLVIAYYVARVHRSALTSKKNPADLENGNNATPKMNEQQDIERRNENDK